MPEGSYQEESWIMQGVRIFNARRYITNPPLDHIVPGQPVTLTFGSPSYFFSPEKIYRWDDWKVNDTTIYEFTVIVPAPWDKNINHTEEIVGKQELWLMKEKLLAEIIFILAGSYMDCNIVCQDGDININCKVVRLYPCLDLINELKQVIDEAHGSDFLATWRILNILNDHRIIEAALQKGCSLKENYEERLQEGNRILETLSAFKKKVREK